MKINHKSQKQGIKPLVWLWQKQLFDPQSREKGQTLVIAFMLGVIVLGATILGVLKSTQSKTKVQADEFAARAIATAEQGIVSFSNELGTNYRELLTLDSSQWNNPPSDVNLVCNPTTDPDSELTSQVTLNDGRSYELKNYDYNATTTTGTLTVKGTEPNGPSNSQAQISVEFDIIDFTPPDSFPGLYASDSMTLGGNEVDGKVICTDCEADKGTAPNCENGEPSDEYIQDATNITGNKDLDDQITGGVIIGDPQIPAPPAPPTTACQQYPLTPGDCYIVLDYIDTDTTLPRTQDLTLLGLDGSISPSPTDRTFYYVLKNNGNSKYDSIKSNTNMTIDSTAAPIRLYITGNYEQAGTSETLHNGTLDKFAIFGCTDELHTLDIDGDGTSNTNCEAPNSSGEYVEQTISISGGSTATSVFIYAPDATVGVNGGSGDADFEAVIWAKTWDGSNSGNVLVDVPDNAEDLITSEYWPSYTKDIGVKVNRIENTGGWRREAVN